MNRRPCESSIPRSPTCVVAGALLLLVLLPDPGASAANQFVRLPDLPASGSISWSPTWGDYDNDGDIDLAFANGGGGTTAQPIDLYRNRGDGTFERLTAAQVGSVVSERRAWAGVHWADVDNDGLLDLVASVWGEAAAPSGVFRNQGDGTFHLMGAGDLTSALQRIWLDAPGDFNGDGWVDFLAPADTRTPPLHLYLNRGDGSFNRIREGPFASEAFASNFDFWADIDNDGDLDVFVPNADAVTPHRDRLYLNDGHGRFTSITNIPLVLTSGQTWHGAWGDYDQDGDFDIILCKAGPPLLFRNDAGTFVPADIGLPKTAGGHTWVDYDNDAYLDLLIERGQGNPNTNSLLHNLGDGTYAYVVDLITTNRVQRQGSAWGDIDNDGDLDLVEVSPLGGARLFRNLGNANHWLKLRLFGKASNAAGLGALVRVRATVGGKPVLQMQQVGGGMPGPGDPRPNFGLGDATQADEIEIRWPSGNLQILENVAADQILDVIEPSGITPARPVATINGSARLTSVVEAARWQWYFEGTLLEGATNRILSLTNVQSAQAGRYSVVTQTGPAPATNQVHLRVDSQFTKIIDGPVVTDRSGGMSATWFDYDKDGSPDLFVANSAAGATPSVLDVLYHNQGDGTFVPADDSAFPATRGWSWSGAPGDFDNDGDLDLFVNQDGLADGGDQLFRNEGNGSFTRVGGQPFNQPGSASLGGIWADYDLDGDLDLFAFRGFESKGVNDALYRNNGDGTFTAVTAAEAGDLVADHLPNWSAAWVDCDRDGAQDLLVSYATGSVRLYHNQRNGSFVSRPAGSLTANPTGFAIAPGDFDNDGWPDLFVTASGSGRTALHRNLGNGTFADVTQASGIVPPPATASPVGNWADYDNDGYLDLFLTGATTNALYRNRGDGTFQSVSLGNLLTDGTWGSMGAWGDYDHNGFPDLYVVIGDATPYPNHLYRNNGNSNHWLKVKLEGTASNRSALGAKVRVRATIGGRTFWQMREIAGNAGWSGAQQLVAEFGLGNAIRATTVRVEWPSGTVQEVLQVTADQVLSLVEPTPWRISAQPVFEGIRISVHGPANTSAELLWSADLRSWFLGNTVTTDAAGAGDVTLPLMPETGRYFRFRKP